jgi:hypothetical protein
MAQADEADAARAGLFGGIPQSAIDQAAKASGLRYAAMETKPFN